MSLEILALLNTFTSDTEMKTTLINELIYECRRLCPSFETQLVEYKMTLAPDSSVTVGEDQPSSSTLSNDYPMMNI